MAKNITLAILAILLTTTCFKLIEARNERTLLFNRALTLVDCGSDTECYHKCSDLLEATSLNLECE